MIVNCSGSELFIFEYLDLVNSEEILSLQSKLLYFLEFTVILASIALVFTVLYLIFYDPLWHKNLRILMSYFIGGSIPVLFCRLVFMYHEITENIIDVCKPSLILATFLRLQYYFAIMHAALALIIERAAAFYFLKDYEKKSRRFIPITILAFQIGLSGAFAVINMSDAFNFPSLFAYMTAMALTSLIAFLCLWQLNLRKFRRIGISARVKDYSLSKRFQLTENLRAFQSIRNVELACAFMLVIVGALGYSAVRGIKTAVGIQIFEISLSCIPKVLTVSLLLSAKKWRAYIFSHIRPAVENFPPAIQQDESQIYFNHLNKAWSKRA